MKHISPYASAWMLLIYFCTPCFSLVQQPDSLSQLSDSLIGPQPLPILETSMIETGGDLTVSSGFTNEDFEHFVLIQASGSEELLIKTDAEKTLQYTLSDVDGIIFRKGQFRKEQLVKLESMSAGTYALYIFRGHRVVRAVLVEKRLPRGYSM